MHWRSCTCFIFMCFPHLTAIIVAFSPLSTTLCTFSSFFYISILLTYIFAVIKREKTKTKSYNLKATNTFRYLNARILIQKSQNIYTYICTQLFYNWIYFCLYTLITYIYNSYDAPKFLYGYTLRMSNPQQLPQLFYADMSTCVFVCVCIHNYLDVI